MNNFQLKTRDDHTLFNEKQVRKVSLKNTHTHKYNLIFRPSFQMVEANPLDGFALVHLGFILKSEENYHEAIPFLRAGIDTADRGTNEGKFFFHLGDSYLRIGQEDEVSIKGKC